MRNVLEPERPQSPIVPFSLTAVCGRCATRSSSPRSAGSTNGLESDHRVCDVGESNDGPPDAGAGLSDRRYVRWRDGTDRSRLCLFDLHAKADPN
jgi:hypothetical protein